MTVSGDGRIMRKILVTGAYGQIGSELVPALQNRFGADNVIVSDIRMAPAPAGGRDGVHEHLDCTQPHQVQEVVRRHGVDAVYHLAALLSARAEDTPQLAWTVNMGGLCTVLEVARQNRLAVFFPSSIGAFGPGTPREATPQVTVQRPSSMYGVTKVSGELLCDYYASRFGVDTRGLRLPGLISYVARPGGGTTDYAVDIFHGAVCYHHYTCFLKRDTRLDMMYMPDAVRAMIELMEADPERLNHRNAYNVAAMSFAPEDLAAQIRAHVPDFAMDYQIDPVRQSIADSWPRSMDDSAARNDWGWTPHYTIETMTSDMLARLTPRLTDTEAG